MLFKKLIPVLFAGLFILVSCENKNDIIPKSDYLKLPSLSAENFQTVTADSGKTDLILSSPIMEQYDNTDAPYTEFRKGLKVEFYDGKPNLQGSVTAKYARFDKNSQIWELKDSVVVINENNDKLETEQLNWDQAKDLIYTDRFVKITSEDEIIQGFGFQSDSHLHRQEIKKVSAIIYVENKEDTL
jgi:LPS export ABC transporter protein LptC